jgi:hypothetical protein
VKMEPHAIAIVADDALSSVLGKLTLVGIYSNITLPKPEITVPQLVFCLFVEFPLSTAPESIIVEIALPGEKTPTLAPITLPPHSVEQRAVDGFRFLFPIANPVLRPGPIRIKIHHGDEFFDVHGPVIVSAPATAAIPVGEGEKKGSHPRSRRGSAERSSQSAQ